MSNFWDGVKRGAGMAIGAGLVCCAVGLVVGGPVGAAAGFKAGVGLGAAAGAGGA